jgi:hypothetical protein
MNQYSFFRPILPLVLLTLISSACKYQVDPNDTAPPVDLHAPDPDLRMSLPDLAQPPDLGGLCSRIGGQRACSRDGAQSGACTDQEEYLADRTCTGDGCSDGHCRRPTPALRCTTDADCSADAGQATTCQPFTTLFNTYDLYCAPAPGSAALFDQCTRHADCAWNVCYPFKDGQGRCTRTCKGVGDCGAMGSCGPLDPLIEGFRITTNFCIPTGELR